MTCLLGGNLYLNGSHPIQGALQQQVARPNSAEKSPSARDAFQSKTSLLILLESFNLYKLHPRSA